MWIKVENNTVVGKVRQTPKSVYDPQLDEHVNLDTLDKRNQYGYHRVFTPKITKAQMLGDIVYNSTESRWEYEVKAQPFDDVVDMDGNFVEKAIDQIRRTKLRELREAMDKVQRAARPYSQRMKDTNKPLPAQFTQQRAALYTRFAELEAEINDETDVAKLAVWEVPQDEVDAAVSSMGKMI